MVKIRRGSLSFQAHASEQQQQHHPSPNSFDSSCKPVTHEGWSLACQTTQSEGGVVRPRHPAPRSTSTSIDGGLVPASSRAPHPQAHYPRAVPRIRASGSPPPAAGSFLASGGGSTRGRWRGTAGSCSSSSSRPPPWPGSPLPPVLSCPVSACWCFLLPILPFYLRL